MFWNQKEKLHFFEKVPLPDQNMSLYEIFNFKVHHFKGILSIFFYGKADALGFIAS